MGKGRGEEENSNAESKITSGLSLPTPVKGEAAGEGRLSKAAD